MLMLIELLKWWYGAGWLDAWRGVGRSTKKVEHSFSIPVLTKNLFAPWKQITTRPGKALDERLRAMADNLVSRTVGFIVRMFTLAIAAAVIIFNLTWRLAVTVAWPLVPLATIYFFVKAIIG
jgi:ABC-type multidrug transport system fused ATPase/permease subunit